jgi:hypothetical protein
MTRSAAIASLASLTASACDGHAATYKTSTFNLPPLSADLSAQNWAMCVVVAQFSIATSQRGSQFSLYAAKLLHFALDVSYFFRQAPPHRCAGLRPLASQI